MDNIPEMKIGKPVMVTVNGKSMLVVAVIHKGPWVIPHAYLELLKSSDNPKKSLQRFETALLLEIFNAANNIEL